MVPFTPKDGELRVWAALVWEQGAKTQNYHLQFQSEGNQYDSYRGNCELGLNAPPAGGVKLQVVRVPGGEHLLATTSGNTVVCGLKDRWATRFLQSNEPVVVGADGLTVGGKLQRFVPEVSQYMAAAEADRLNALMAEIRTAGQTVKGDSNVWGSLNLSGGNATVLAWGGGVALKPEGKPALIFPFTQNGQHLVFYAYPEKVGVVTAAGHQFLAVVTHQPGAPNGGDVLVLEYDPAGGALKSVFHGSGDGAGFYKDRVFTSVKLYRPQGGFDIYTTVYTWDEAGHTFVKGDTTKGGDK
jgi:hypothetical protein